MDAYILDRVACATRLKRLDEGTLTREACRENIMRGPVYFVVQTYFRVHGRVINPKQRKELSLKLKNGEMSSDEMADWIRDMP